MPYEFRTIVDTGRYDATIEAGTKVFLAGSCFADNMGAKFHEHRLKAMVNPFGVLYNPVSIARLLERTMEREYCQDAELEEHNALWHSFDFHGSFSDPDRDTVRDRINHSIDGAAGFLENAGFLIITFGTSYVFERNDTTRVVANCHKFPPSFFNRYRLDPDEIIARYKELIVALRVFNPHLKILFTVSPVRHWKDRAHGNQVSKSVLLLAIDKLCDLFDKVWYFPAYEIVMDELRDYRFYDEGMLNPSKQAVDYVWSRFTESLLSEKALTYIKRTAKVAKAREHRFLNSSTDSHQKFLENGLNLINRLMEEFPEANLQADREYFGNLLYRGKGDS